MCSTKSSTEKKEEWWYKLGSFASITASIVTSERSSFFTGLIERGFHPLLLCSFYCCRELKRKYVVSGDVFSFLLFTPKLVWLNQLMRRDSLVCCNNKHAHILSFCYCPVLLFLRVFVVAVQSGVKEWIEIQFSWPLLIDSFHPSTEY
jgi:hypothetical protein